jgi:hypothetical protein
LGRTTGCWSGRAMDEGNAAIFPRCQAPLLSPAAPKGSVTPPRSRSAGRDIASASVPARRPGSRRRWRSCAAPASAAGRPRVADRTRWPPGGGGAARWESTCW